MNPINKLAQDIGSPAADLAATAVNLMRLVTLAASSRVPCHEHLAVEIRRSMDRIAVESGRIGLGLATYDATAIAESEAKP